MKISQSQLNKSRDRKRMTRSFAIAFFVYVPIDSSNNDVGQLT